jgi:phosphotriesterase-related protein
VTPPAPRPNLGDDNLVTATDFGHPEGKELTAAGYARQIVLSHDYAGCWQFSEEDMLPYVRKLMTAPKRLYTYLIEGIHPALREAAVSQSDIDTMTVENPRRYFAGESL